MAALLRSKLVLGAAIVAALVGLYALLGFKLAPKLVRDNAITFVRETYGRELEIGAVHVQPFKLQLEIRDLAFPDADGQTMLGFERFFADFELSSLWKRAYYFRAVELDAPQIRAVVRPQGALNLADLAIEEPPGEPVRDPPAEPEPLPSIWIADLNVDRGFVDFLDQARSKPFERHFSPVAFTLKEFRTTPEGGDFGLTAQSEAGEKFDWKGRFALAPVIRSSGDFSIDDLRAPGVGEFLGDALPFLVTGGVIDLGGSYVVTLGEQTALDVTLPTVQLTDLTLRAQGVDEDWVRLPSVVVSDTQARLPEQKVTVGRVLVANLEARAWRDASGDINVTRLFAPVPVPPVSDGAVATAATAPADGSAAVPAAPASASPAAEASSAVWDVQVAEISVDDAVIDFEERSLTPALATRLAPIDLTVSNVSLDLAKPVPVTFATTIDGSATLTAKGDVTPEPLTAALDVELRDLDLKRLQPFAAGTTDLTIRGGKAGAAGRFELHPAGGKEPELSFAGDATVSMLRTIDNALEEDFFNVDRVEVRKLRYALAPDSLAIDRILVSKPFARVINASNGIVNVQSVLDPEGAAAALREREAEAAAAAEPEDSKATKQRGRKPPPKKVAPAPAEPPRELVESGMPIRIREVRIDGGRMDFADYFIEPNFAADIRSLEGSLSGLSTDPNAHAKVDLKGKVGEFSPVTIAGQVQPFAFDRYTDIGLRFENISLPVFNPYSGRYAGFNIAKGNLTTDLHYGIVNRKLDAKHHIRIDQLEWGEATASKEGVPLPIKFATSLLKDVNGVIDLDVPVTGTLDDPKFRVGPIVWKIIKNILVKAVTAPFRLLGSLFEGAEDAQFVDFAPGDATLDAATSEKLGALAKGLAQKPEIKLDIPIGEVAALDEPALRDKRYGDELAAAMKRVLGKKAAGDDGVPVTFDSLEPERQIDVLVNFVRQASGAPVNLPKAAERPEGMSRKDAKLQAQQATIEYLQNDAKGRITVAPADVEALSQARANAVQSALLASGELEPSRVFLARSDKVSALDGKVRLELTLE